MNDTKRSSKLLRFGRVQWRRNANLRMVSLYIHRLGYCCVFLLGMFLWAAIPDLSTRTGTIVTESEPNFIKFPLRAQVAHANSWVLGAENDIVCAGRKFYMYDLPAAFNTDLELKCKHNLIGWLNLCPHFENSGYGKNLETPHWYGTDAYMLEVIFHKRMETYPCRTEDPSSADAFFIPYYAGLDALPYLYNKTATLKERNLLGVDLVAWLEKNAGEWWERHGGKDHLLVVGRTSWDFNLPFEKKDDSTWGTTLQALPHIQNLTSLYLERQPWMDNEQAIPYPTSFHPSSRSALQDWIEKVRHSKREFLYAFVGAPRPGLSSSIRSLLADQCLNAGPSECNLVDCSKMKCSHNPVPITDALLKAEFCLQPRGDSATRRSLFDSIIAGCIPVLFSADSAYKQYTWHLPEVADTYSVYISEEEIRNGVQLKEALTSIPRDKVIAMRETLLLLIPNIIYVNYDSQPGSAVEDAFELTLRKFLRKLSSSKSN